MNTETKVTNQDKVEKILFWTMIVSVVTFVAALIIYVVANWGGMFSDFKARVKEKNSPYQSPPQTPNKTFQHNIGYNLM